MCGRYVQSKSRRQYERYMRAMESKEPAEEHPSWNIPPTATSWVARAVEGQTHLDRMTWGFPGSATTGLISNARIETVSIKPTFAEAWKFAHCLIPVEGWYEWKSVEGQKRPIYFSLPSEAPFCLVGLWKENRFVVLTTETLGQLRTVHTRRPVTLGEKDIEHWLNFFNGIQTADDLLSVTTLESDFLLTEVSDEVNGTRNDGPHLLSKRKPQLSQSLFPI
jgi:putative SOS response-associated peptidase YedK